MAGRGRDRATSNLAIPLSQQNVSSGFTEILLKTPAQTQKLNEVQLCKGTEKNKQTRKKQKFSSSLHSLDKTVNLVTPHL